MDELTAQQSLLLDQKRQVLGFLDQANDALDSKAMNIIQTAGVILVLVGVLTAAGFISEDNLSGFDKASLIIATSAFVIMMILSAISNWPVISHYPGVSPGDGDWEKMYSQYVYSSIEECFAQVLEDYQNSIKSLQEINSAKSKFVVAMIILLVVISASLLTILIF